MSKGGSGKLEETEEERELARVSADKWNDYVSNFIPFENEFIRRIEVTDQDREGLKGSVAAGVNTSFNDHRQDVVEQQTQAGARPGSGRFNQALERVLQKQGRSLGYNTVDAENSMDQRRVDGLSAAINIGRGKEAGAFAGMGNLASNAYDNAQRDVQTNNQRRNSTLGAVGTVIGGVARHNYDIGGSQEEGQG